MNKLTAWLLGAGIGVGFMYFLDPVSGDRRKAMVRDQVTRQMNRSDQVIDKTYRDLRNRARGLLAETTGRLSDQGQTTPDWILAERVRSRIGSVSRYAGGINVDVQNGIAHLTGPVYREDVDSIVQNVSSIKGIDSVDNSMEVHDNIQDIPQYQGMQPSGDGATNWSPSSRVLAGLGAGTLLLAGRSRGGLIGTAFSLAGVGLAFRAVTNMEFTKALGLSEETGVIHVNKGIHIDAPIDVVYNYWSNFENFPNFMSHVKEIHKMGDNRSHWVVEGPAGVPVEFDAITTREVPNDIITWETMPDAEVKSRGRVRFREANDGTTQVNVNMWYTPPAGVVGHAIATIFGADPKQAMDDDLMKLKNILEEGNTGGTQM